MPSHLHEALLQLFRNRPLLAPELLQRGLQADLPRYTDARIHSADLTEVQPAEYRADLVVQLMHEKPVLAIVLEVQLSRDKRKRYVWPAYAASLHAQLECPVHVLVITACDAVARWAAKPVDIGGGNIFAPNVVGPLGVPEIEDDLRARADPELAVLSTIAHGHDADFTKAARIAAAAQRASLGLDSDRAHLYFDLIHTSLSEAARRALRQMMPPNYEYQSAFARKYYGQGKRAGRAQGNRETLTSIVTKQLAMRFGQLDDAAHSRIAAASTAELLRVAERLLTAPTLDDALGQN
jgi:hypothetical protein